MNKLNILMAASEVVPFAKSGGLADVIGALPKSLNALGHDVRIVMPRYYIVDKEKFKLQKLNISLSVSMGNIGELYFGVYTSALPGSDVIIYFIEYDEYFGRKGLYDDNSIGYNDNDNRFIFFSKAVMELAKKLRFRPDVIHANDWHTAAISVLLNTTYAYEENFKNTGSLLTIHNLQHQGKFYKGTMDVLGVGWEHFNANELEEYDGVNLLKGGIVHADAINAVSKKYAQEIRTSEFGWGLEGVINDKAYKLFGILNGVDYDEWSPAVDSMIAKTFESDTMSGKKVCKQKLQKFFQLPSRDDVALIGFVGRLAAQKGIELIIAAIDELMQLDIQIVLLGTGEKGYEEFFEKVSCKYPDKFASFIGYKNDLAHQIEAGSDMFLMPSLFEPCGLNQIYSLRYATLPIVRATGGLDDTIQNYTKREGIVYGNGFKFYDATPQALTETLKWAVNIYYNDKKVFEQLCENAIHQRFSWKVAAKSYETLYRHIVSGRLKNYSNK